MRGHTHPESCRWSRDEGGWVGCAVRSRVEWRCGEAERFSGWELHNYILSTGIALNRIYNYVTQSSSLDLSRAA